MSKMYGQAHRSFQDQHDTRRLADRLEAMAHAEFDERDREFIQGASMFFLSTVDEHGMPTVSYKGGRPGFVRVTGANELQFPAYDGNGMFLSLGNLSATRNVGLLFIDFSQPRRLRIQGTAHVLPSPSEGGLPAGAQHVVAVTAASIYVNCGRYIHKALGMTLSAHVPAPDGGQPFPTWKRIDKIADALSDADRAKVDDAGGPIPIESYRGEDLPDLTMPSAG
jgi:uncharacterized protein